MRATFPSFLAVTTLSRYYARAWRNEVGPPGSWTEEQMIDGGKGERETRLRMSKETQGHGPSTQKTRMDTETKRHECMYINKWQINNRARDRLQPNRPANRCRCLLVCARKRYDGGAAGSTRAFLEAARASRKPAEKNYGEWRRRSVRPAIRQHFVLYNARSPSHSVSLSFIASRGSRFPH